MNSPRLTLKGDVAQGPEVVGMGIGRLGTGRLVAAAEQACQRVAQACTEHRRSGVGALVYGAEVVELAQVVDADGDVRHGVQP